MPPHHASRIASTAILLSRQHRIIPTPSYSLANIATLTPSYSLIHIATTAPSCSPSTSQQRPPIILHTTPIKLATTPSHQTTTHNQRHRVNTISERKRDGGAARPRSDFPPKHHGARESSAGGREKAVFLKAERVREVERWERPPCDVDGQEACRLARLAEREKARPEGAWNEREEGEAQS